LKSTGNIPLLKIVYPEISNTVDYAALELYPSYHEGCIFIGQLLNSFGSQVTISGSCDFKDSFEVRKTIGLL